MRARHLAKMAIGAILLAVAALAQAQVQMRQETLRIPTYRVGPAEKNPIFFSGRSYQGAKGPIYPYPILDKLTDIKEDRAYKAIFLENPYVQYSVLPEIGGRIFTGLDKTNQYDFIYRQHVIKPALIGMVGAWISGGVEWNIPHHHRASTFMEVDHRLIENPDGSKTIWLGEIELRHRMKWIVGLTLYPDRSYLKVTVKLFNRTPLPHSMLYFANIAVHANEQYQVLFPPGTEYGTQHGKKEFVSWPIGGGVYGGMDRKGVDLSWWKNLPTPASIFAWNYEDDFFGGFDHGKQAGIAVIADHHTAPGKKFFEWGNGNEGKMWDKILTDEDGPYLELMAGGYSDNQPDYSWVQPGEVKVVEQYYYPIRQLGGLKNANLDAAVNLEVKGNVARVAVNTTAQFTDAKVVLKRDQSLLLEQQVTISPDKPFTKDVELPAGTAAESLRLSVLSKEGKELIAYQSVKPKNSPMPQAVQPPPAPKDIKTNEELYLTGLRLEQFHSPALEPYPYYEEALKRDPGDYRANVALGILYLKRAMYKEAQARLEAAVERATRDYINPKDGEAFYYLGVALRSQKQFDAAANAFHRATWSSTWSAASNHALAELACRKSDFVEALKFIERSLASNAVNTKALALKATILRKLKRLDETEATTAIALGIDPLDHAAHYERYAVQMQRGDGAQNRLAELRRLMRGEVSSYLELAVDYGNAGFKSDADSVLVHFLETVPDKSKVNPMVHYYLGALAAASEMPPAHCLPFQLEMIDVLQAAIQRSPKDARAPYYLGNLLFDLQPQQAIKYWEQSRQIDPKFATVHRNLALAYAQIERDNAKAIASLEKAVECDGRDPKLYAELDALYEAGNVEPAKRLALLQKNHDVVAQRDDALLREIHLLILQGEYDRAIALLENHHFHVWEGERGIHDVYADAHLLRGRKLLGARRYAEALKDFEAALEYPTNLETARPSRGGGKLAEINYCLGLLHEARGQADEARSAFQRAVQGAGRGMGEGSEVQYYQGLAYAKLGQGERAAQLFDGLIRFGQERLKATDEVDFFAKFGTRRFVAAKYAHAHYLVGLGHLGKGQRPEARKELEAALALNTAHLGARTALAELR